MKSIIKTISFLSLITFLSVSILNAQRTTVRVSCPEGDKFTCYEIFEPDGTVSTSVKKGQGSSEVVIVQEFIAQ